MWKSQLPDFPLRDLLGNHPLGLASVFASHQSTGAAAKEQALSRKASRDSALRVLTPLLDSWLNFALWVISA